MVSGTMHKAINLRVENKQIPKDTQANTQAPEHF